MDRWREIEPVLKSHLRDAASSFSVGSFGAIAEFHRDPDEPYTIDDGDALTIVTARGGLRIAPDPALAPLAYEALSANPERWQHGVIFCLPADRARSAARTRLSELGPDTDALRESECAHILFDMGLGAQNVDFCVRTGDPDLIALLRAAEGRSLLAPDNPVMGQIVAADPHRVVISRIARAEVYQPIGRSVTPEGPHTHVLPDLLKGGRTHSANVPVPAGQMPILELHPRHPADDALGRARGFDPSAYEAFRRLLSIWGDADYLAEKTRAETTLEAGTPPDDYEAAGRIGRTALRIVLRQRRQLKRENPDLERWIKLHDRRRVS